MKHSAVTWYPETPVRPRERTLQITKSPHVRLNLPISYSIRPENTNSSFPARAFFVNLGKTSRSIDFSDLQTGGLVLWYMGHDLNTFRRYFTLARKFKTMDGNTAAAHVSYAFTEVAGIYPTNRLMIFYKKKWYIVEKMNKYYLIWYFTIPLASFW